MRKIKRYFSILFLLVLAVILQNCSSLPVDRTGFLPPVKIRISNGVMKDTATANFVKSSEKVINELSDRMENVARNGKELLRKKDEDMTVMEKINMTKLSVQFMAVSNSLANEMEKIQHYIDEKQTKGISKMDLKAYESVEKAIEKRINDLNNKYKDLIVN